MNWGVLCRDNETTAKMNLITLADCFDAAQFIDVPKILTEMEFAGNFVRYVGHTIYISLWSLNTDKMSYKKSDAWDVVLYFYFDSNIDGLSNLIYNLCRDSNLVCCSNF